jgi:hypothetical protein
MVLTILILVAPYMKPSQSFDNLVRTKLYITAKEFSKSYLGAEWRQILVVARSTAVNPTYLLVFPG